MTFKCNICEKEYTELRSLKRHQLAAHEQTSHCCPTCNKTFGRADHLRKHQFGIHGTRLTDQPPINHTCSVCTRQFNRSNNLKRHYSKVHGIADPSLDNASSVPVKMIRLDNPTPPTQTDSEKDDMEMCKVVDELEEDIEMSRVLDELEAGKPIITPLQTPLKGSLKTYVAETIVPVADPELYLSKLLEPLEEVVNKALRERPCVKVWICLHIEYFKPLTPEETAVGYHRCNQVPIFQLDNITEKLQGAFPKILSSVAKYEQKGSGWVIKKVIKADIHLSRYRVTRGSCYKPLPGALKKKEAVINIKNTDDKCFIWSVLAALHPAPRGQNASSLYHYTPYEHELDTTGLQFPMDTRDIPMFERLNNVSINIYGWEGMVFPLYISQAPGHHIDLLIYDDHYCLVPSLDRLLSNQRQTQHKKYFCHRCLYPLYTAAKLVEHEPRCTMGQYTRLLEPKHDTIQFRNLNKQMRQPVVVYADFESFTTPISSCKPNPNLSATTRYQHHIPCSFGLLEVHQCCNDVPEFPSDPDIYIGKDCSRKFVEKLVQIVTDVGNRLDDGARNMINVNEHHHQHAHSCVICNEPFFESHLRAHHHCHFCKEYIGPAHMNCNLECKQKREIAVVLHNLRRYDSHLIMQEIGSVCKDMDLTIDVVGKGLEDYLSFSIVKRGHKEDGIWVEKSWKIKFIDSLQFLPSSLEALVKTVPTNNFHAVKQVFGEDDTPMLLRKGVFPYDWFSSEDKLESSQLPPPEMFHSRLTGEDISNEDYQHAQRMWSHFGMQTFRDYHNLYLVLDVLLLCDVFTEFRNLSLGTYQLDPAQYITIPSLAWDACLKLTKTKLDSITDPDLYTFLEKGIRGGIAVISHREAHANYPAQGENYDSNKPSQYIIYVDANNLYGWAMVRHLPTSGFHWVEQAEADMVDWRNHPDDSNTGYILEVDLEYPLDLHDTHNAYPLAPDNLAITEDMLSPYASYLKQQLGLGNAKVSKLAPNLFNKKKYVLHYQNLKLYLRMGMKLKAVHCAIGFNQEPWLKPYIELNTRLRTQATTKFAKDLFKLMNNSVFGKSMENVRKYKDIQLVTTEEQFTKRASNPRYKRSAVFSDDLVGMAMQKLSMRFDKPIYMGMSILDMSKILMYEYHYDYIIPTYQEKATLLFTDTDSFAYCIQTPDIYQDMKNDEYMLDTSEYPQDHFLYSTTNKKVLGKFKDETNGTPIEAFIGLRAKMYSFKCGGVDKKRAKGVKKCVVQKEITHEQYEVALNERKRYRHTMNLFRNDRHQIYTVSQIKSSLSPFDDKRYILDDGITTLAYGHHRTRDPIDILIDGLDDDSDGDM